MQQPARFLAWGARGRGSSVKLAALAVTWLIAACENEPSIEVREAYPPYTATTEMKYVRSTPDGRAIHIGARVVGQLEIGGKSYNRLRFDGSSPTTGVEAWLRVHERRVVELAGLEYTTGDSELLGMPEQFSLLLDEPVAFSLDPALGEPQSFNLRGEAQSSAPGEAGGPRQAGEITGSYTLAAKEIGVPTPAGIVTGCRHFRASGFVPWLFGGDAVPAEGDIWYSPVLGLVRAQVSEPLSNLSVAFAGTSGHTDLGDGWASVHAIALLGRDAAQSFALSTYDVHNASDADKQARARMLLEVRWVEEERARTESRPAVKVQLGAAGRVLSSTLEPSPTSFFHPGEDDRGFVHWIGFVEEAANEGDESGTRYDVEVDYDASYSPIRVTARIVYKLLTAPASAH